MLITLEEKDGKLNVNLSGDITWVQALRMLLSAIDNLAHTTVDMVVKNQLSNTKKPSKKAAMALTKEVSSDVADMINEGTSFILNKLCPRDPDLQLTEVAIATMENEIIHKAKAEGKPLKQVLKEYQDNLIATSEHPAVPSQKPASDNVVKFPKEA